MDIVDAFVVTLGLDPRNYQREIKTYRDDRKRLAEEDAKYNRQSEDAQKRMVQGVRTLRNETAGFLFMLAGANSVKDFANNILTGDAATGRLARNLGLATEQVSAWEGAIKRVGGSAADIGNSLRAMSSAFQSLQLTGTTGHDADFQGLGVTAKDLQNPEQALLKISEASQRMSRPEFNARTSRIGFDQNTINLLAKGRVEVTRMLEEQRKLGVATDADAEAAQRFQDRLAVLETAITAKARPALEKLVGVVGDWLMKGDNLNTVLTVTEGILAAIAIGAAIAYWPFALLAGAIALVATNLDKLKAAWDGFEQWHKNLGESTDSFFDPVRKFFGLKTGAEAREAGTDIFGNPNDMRTGTALDPNRRSSNGGGAPSARGSVAGGRGPARVPRGQRAVALDGNNPGGINDGSFARSQPGYVGNNGRYAAFATMADGIAAQRALLASYVRRGYDTPAKIANRWAPVGDGNNSAAYAANIARQMGISVNDRIGAAQLNAFQHAQAMTENHNYGGARPGMTARAASSVSSSTSSQTTSVGQIIVYSAATDAEGIAHDMRGALAKRGLVVQANTGLQP